MGAPQVNQTASALKMKHKAHIHPESIECFIEGQAAPSPLSRQQIVFLMSMNIMSTSISR
jgi:hypothetical protein